MDKAPVKTLLANGVRVVSQHMAHTRSVSMGVWVNAGARDESVHENGLSHFIEHMIFKGTRRRSAFQIAKEFDAIGGHTNAFTSMEHTCYHAKVLDSQTAVMADILTDIFLNSVFDPEEVDRERPVILQEIGMLEDCPDDYIHHLTGLNFWGNDPLGRSILGPRENIERFGAEAIRGFFQRLYQPERIVVAAAGNLDHRQLLDWVGPAFETLRPGDGFPERLTPQTRAQVEIHRRDLEQVHICFACPGLSLVDPQRYAFSLMSTVFGGNMSSRLFQEVRERRGLAYSVFAFTASHADTGMLGIYLAVSPQQALEAVAVVLEEVARLSREPVTASELEGAVEYTKGNLLLAAENADNQMVRSAQNEIHFGRDISLEDVIERIDAVTPAEILELASAKVRPELMALTLLGPVEEPPAAFEDCLNRSRS